MTRRKSIYAYLILAGLTYGQHTLVSSDETSSNAANLYTSHSIKFDSVKGEPAEENSQESIVISQPKPQYSQTFHECSSEEALITLVDEAIIKNPDHACEAVKQAIAMSRAQESLICRIVEAAILAAPDQIRLITQCAIAAAPDSLSSIQLLIATYEASGDSNTSGKEVSGKDVSGKEVSGKEVSGKDVVARGKEQLKLKAIDILQRSELGTPSTSSPRRLNPVGYPAPSLISPNSSTKTETSNP